jgi:hypothetical protein
MRALQPFNLMKATLATSSVPGSLLGIVATFCAAALLSPTLHAQSTWTGGSANWTSNASPGWNGTGVPNAQGTSVTKTDATSATITQNVAAGVTVGSWTLTGAAGTFGVTLTNGITFDQDGAGAGFATINNAGTNASSRLNFGSGSFTLADNLLISNSGNSTNATGSVAISSNISGNGNITFNNVSNNAAAGQISIGASNTFSGTVSIQRGAVTISNNASLGNASNTVHLGSAGNSATLISTSNSGTHAYNITVVATTGSNLLGSNSASATNTAFLGTILLNGNASLTSSKAAGADVRYTGVISGTGDLTIAGTGETQLGDGTTTVTNTYTGNTQLTETSSLVLGDNARLTFVIGASGTNNKISGNANQTLTLDGDFVFNLTGAASVGSWTIVDVTSLNETFSNSFSVVGFTQNADVWTFVSGATTYTFTEASGVLTAVPEPSTALLSGLGLAVALFGVRRRKA